MYVYSNICRFLLPCQQEGGTQHPPSYCISSFGCTKSVHNLPWPWPVENRLWQYGGVVWWVSVWNFTDKKNLHELLKKHEICKSFLPLKATGCIVFLMNFASNAPLFKVGTVRVQMQKHSEYKKECALRIKATNCVWAKEGMVMCHENVFGYRVAWCQCLLCLLDYSCTLQTSCWSHHFRQATFIPSWLWSLWARSTLPALKCFIIHIHSLYIHPLNSMQNYIESQQAL